MKYTPKQLKTQELIEIFPEAKRAILINFKVLKAEREEMMECMRNFQNEVKQIAEQEQKEEFFVWFWAHAFIKYFYAFRLVEVDRRLGAIRTQVRFLNSLEDSQMSKGVSTSFEDWEGLKQRAKEADIETVVAGYLNKARRYGNQIKALCPFHQEKTPSFVIYLSSNQYHCFGCQKHGDVISFLMEKEGIGFKEAVRRLAL